MKRLKTLPTVLAGAALVALGGTGNNAQADTTNLIANTTYEDAVYDDLGEIVTPDGRPRWPWAYHYQWGYPADPAVDPIQDTMAGEPVDAPTNIVNRVQFDTSAYAGAPDGAGFGQGFGAGMNWQRFNPETVWPTNLQYYVVSFDARAEGLKPGVNDVTVEMQTQFDAPDDTIVPADANTDADRIIQVNKALAVGSTWKHYVYTLDTFSNIGGGSEQNLALYAAAMNSANYNVNVHMPSDAFDYDSENFIVIDNIKLEVINSTNRPPPAPPMSAVLISEWNFDDKDTWFDYGYGYSPGGTANPTQTQTRHAEGEGVDGSNGWSTTMDNTIYAGMDPKPAWAGVGMGTGGPLDASLMNTTDLASYRLTFTSRAEGLAPDTTSTMARLQVMLRGTDDFLQPADGDTEGDTLVRLDFDVPAQTNWVTTSYLLSKGSVGGGSKQNVTNFLATTATMTEWRPQFQIENPLNESVWGYDADNKLVIDNVKLERLVPGVAPLTAVVSNDQLTITWAAPSTGTTKLLATDKLESGPWTEVTTTGNSYTTTTSGTLKFFRTEWVPPTQ